MPVARKPQDHRPKKRTAQQREAEGDHSTVIHWRGHDIVLDTDRTHLTGATVLAFEEGKAMSGIRGLIGAAQWGQVADYTLDDLEELFDELARALGFGDSGESSASSD